MARYDLASLSDEGCRRALVRTLCEDGVLLLRADGLESVIAKAYRAVKAFFARPFDDKAQHGAHSGVGQLHGYMPYLDEDEDGSEAATQRFPPCTSSICDVI